MTDLRQLARWSPMWAVVGCLAASLHGAASTLLVLVIAAMVHTAGAILDGPGAGLNSVDSEAVIWLLAGFALVLLLERIASLVAAAASQTCAETTAIDLATRRLCRVARGPQRGESNSAPARRIGKVSVDLKTAQARLPEVWDGLFAVIRRAITLVSATGLVLWYNTIAGVAIAIMSVITIYWDQRQHRQNQEIQNDLNKASTHASQMREVALAEKNTAELVFLNTQRWLSSKHAQRSKIVTQIATQQVQRTLGLVAVSTVVRGAVLIGITMLILHQLSSGAITAAIFVAQVLAVRSASNAASILQSSWTHFTANLQVVQPHLSTIPELSAAAAVTCSALTDAGEAGTSEQAVVVRGLRATFAPKLETAEGAGLDIPALTLGAGENVVILGDNGSGKSTLLNILCGARQHDSGTVSLAGYSPDTASQLRRVCVVPQEILRLPFSLADNVRLGHEVDDTAVRRICQRVGLLRDPGMLTLDTVLSSRHGGQDLSGGQWQRVALARMLVQVHTTQPDVVLLDEPVAAADLDLEELLPSLLAQELSNTTTITVTHRLSIAQHVDRILVMSRGKIVESGTVEELNATASIYRTWRDLQQHQDQHIPHPNAAPGTPSATGLDV